MNRARKDYNQLWKKVAKIYGQPGSKPPAFTPVGKGGGDAYVNYNPDNSPQRSVNISPQERTQLKKHPDKAQFTLLHEWAHTAGAGSEGHANRVANLATRELRGKLAEKAAKRKIRKTLSVNDG